ncbi:MAG TPA: CBS domain-containing protein, partial [Nitrospirae bacterium]|nr:CBS domain-containing protein [Nitrospirota bacterium]
AHKLIDRFKKEASGSGVDLEIVSTGCQGICQKGPVLKVEPMDIFYQRTKPKHVPWIMSYSMLGNMPYRQGLYRDNFLSEPVTEITEIPFYKKQKRIALRNNGIIDPRNINHFIAVGGYAGLEKALFSMTPDQVLEEVDKANLRGRGGAGFPAGKKWAHTQKAPGDIKLVIANGDEGDPGAFMDRSIMEGDPHSLLEGMLINAYAIGARYGIVYVRHEYPLAVKNLQTAIDQAEELGLLGKNILGTDFSLTINIREGAGAFVCGESTALVASIEGERGFPRPRPPRLSEPGGGPWGYPSSLNNIETFANVPVIIEKGSDYFLSIGTKNSSGTKVFALTGKVKNTGLVEVPMGITLREIIFDIGGGILGDKEFKAVQTGGPSGGCIPAEHLDLPVDFDSLWSVGSMMGSGGMVVMDEDTCMVDVAKFFLSFTQSESCGKCPPCRIGTYQMLQILERITSGQGRKGDVRRLVDLGTYIQRGSLCGLGNSAPNPVLSTIKYFREEYEEHIYEKYCKANVCKGMGAFVIDQNACIRCGLCEEACAFGAVTETRERYKIDRTACTQCKACYTACPVNAVLIKKPRHVALEAILKVPTADIEIIDRRAKMILRDIVSKKPSEIFTVTQDQQADAAVKLMTEKKISNVLVIDEGGKLTGIVTERDIVRCIHNKVSIDKVQIKDVMTKNVITFDPSLGIGAALQIVAKEKIRHLPIVEKDKLLGIITYRDLISHVLPEIIYMAEEVY